MGTAIEINPKKFLLPPFKHQMDGIRRLVRQKWFALFDEMGVGKTKQTIDAACVLYDNGIINTVIIACPAQTKTVWRDPDLGEIRKHAWVPSNVCHYYGGHTTIKRERGTLTWVVVSYEFLRQDTPLQRLLKQIDGDKTMLVMDESIFLKSPKARQTRQMYELAKVCARRYILNGTPIGNNLLDLYAQFKMLHPDILGCSSYFHFRARYAIMGGFQNKQVIGFKNAEDINRLTAPYVLRRLKEDCLDLPPKTYTHSEVALSAENWKRYKSMRDDMVVWLDSEACMVQHAPVKAMRLSQITSGFLGGISDVEPAEFELLGMLGSNPVIGVSGEARTEEIGREKLDFIMGWLEQRYAESSNFRVLIWCRFRKELERLFDTIRGEQSLTKYNIRLHSIYGQQSRTERDRAVQEGMAGNGAAVILGNPHAGGFGLNLTTLPYVVYLSSDYSLLTRQQSEDRVHRPGQTRNVEYLDVIATGPDGQRTIDHQVVKALRKKEEMANWTTERWRVALMEE